MSQKLLAPRRKQCRVGSRYTKLLDRRASSLAGAVRQWAQTHRAGKRAYEHNPKAIQEWLDEDYPEIRARAKAENAEIHWGDETELRKDSQHEKGYTPKGKTPVVRLNANRK